MGGGGLRAEEWGWGAESEGAGLANCSTNIYAEIFFNIMNFHPSTLRYRSMQSWPGYLAA